MPKRKPVNPELPKARQLGVERLASLRGAEPDPVIRKAKWASLKEEFIELASSGKPIHWPTLASKFGFNPATVRNRASLDKWYNEIDQRRKDREAALDTHLVERTAIALEQLNSELANNEANIRRRYAVMARGLQAKALKRIKDLKIDELSARDALAMLRMGIEEERFALGLKEHGAPPIETPPGESEYQSVMAQVGDHRKVQAIGGLILKALQGSDMVADLLAEAGLGPVDVEAKEVKRP